MKDREQFFSLLQAQDDIRRVWAFRESGTTKDWLRKIDKELTKVINEIGRNLPNENLENHQGSNRDI